MSFLLVSNSVSYKAKWIPTVCTSSTKAEFITDVSAAKTAKYLRLILKEFEISQEGPTDKYGDNAAAIIMANAKKSTE